MSRSGYWQYWVRDSINALITIRHPEQSTVRRLAQQVDGDLPDA